MGCFSFTLNRKVSDRSPDTTSDLFAKSITRINPPVGSSSLSSSSIPSYPTSPPSDPWLFQTALKSPQSLEKKQKKFGGLPQPLPLPAPPPSALLTSNPSTKKATVKRLPQVSSRRIVDIPTLPNSIIVNIPSSNQATPSPSQPSPSNSQATILGGGWYSAEKPTKLITSNSTHCGLTTFTLDDLERITNLFSSDGYLGAGGFGAVYKGVIQDPTSDKCLEVAVKVLNTEGHQGETEWLTEVTLLGHLHHEHLVELLGYCSEGDERMLVYKYMPNGSLEDALFHRATTGRTPLSWHNRLKIALGAARGLQYLHEEAEHQIIYRDFKTSNVLLDKRFEAKLSDFGLARNGPEGDASHVTTRVVGTMGYAAPEYVLTGHLTAKSDVWSFGVVLLELLTGRVANDANRPQGEQDLVEWAESYLAQPSKLYKIMDPELGGKYSVKGAQQLAALVQSCLGKKPKLRPKMSDVVRILEPILEMHDMAGFSMEELRSASQKYRSNSRSLRKPSNKIPK